jgi:hypothetical protein
MCHSTSAALTYDNAALQGNFDGEADMRATARSDGRKGPLVGRVAAEPTVGLYVQECVDLFSNADLADMAACNEFPRRLFASSSNVRNVGTFFSTHRAKFEANAPIVNLSKAAE